MVQVVHIENNSTPAEHVKDAIGEIRLSEERGGKIKYRAVIDPAHDDQTVEDILRAAGGKGQVHLALVDLHLGDKYSGIDAAKCIKKFDARIKVILFTVMERLPAGLQDQVTRETIYDYYVHKFGTIYRPGEDPGKLDDVQAPENLQELCAPGIVTLQRVIKFLLEQRGSIRREDWLAPDVAGLGSSTPT